MHSKARSLVASLHLLSRATLRPQKKSYPPNMRYNLYWMYHSKWSYISHYRIISNSVLDCTVCQTTNSEGILQRFAANLLCLLYSRIQDINTPLRQWISTTCRDTSRQFWCFDELLRSTRTCPMRRNKHQRHEWACLSYISLASIHPINQSVNKDIGDGVSKEADLLSGKKMSLSIQQSVHDCPS